jgi:hypothetical protein
MASWIRGLMVAASALLLAGCMSARGTSTLQPLPDAEQRLAGLQFRVAAIEEGPANPQEAAQGLQRQMSQAYPRLFSDDLEAIPLLVRFKTTPDNNTVGAFIGGFFTLGTLPVPTWTGFSREVGVTPWTANGAALPVCVIRYTRRDHVWVTVFTPLALIPMPGRSDMDRDVGTILNADSGYKAYAQKQQAFNDLNLQQAVLSAVAGLDTAALRRLAEERKALPAIEVDIDGRHYSGRLLAAFSQGMRQAGGADEYRLVLRNTDVRDGRQTITTHYIPVARRGADGAWTAQRSYLSFSSRPMLATALVVDGLPRQPVVMPVEQPPLADFLVAPETRPESAAPVRWSNGILLQIKNTSLAAELAGKSLPELQQLLTQLEGALLELNERVGRANDRAQQAMEKGETPDALRELAVVYRQRGEILKAILVQVRQETAARGAP